MSPPDLPDSMAKRWLADARSELIVAMTPLPDGVWPSVMCFHAQRAAEKAIKAVHEFWQTPVTPKQRKTHSIERLVEMLDLAEVPETLRQAARLTFYAVETHYVDDLADPAMVTQKHLDEAIPLARAVVQWAASVIEAPTEA